MDNMAPFGIDVTLSDGFLPVSQDPFLNFKDCHVKENVLLPRGYYQDKHSWFNKDIMKLTICLNLKNLVLKLSKIGHMACISSLL